ncbi:MAG: MBL fold metallo-hydrolase [Phycisphaerales bacterium]
MTTASVLTIDLGYLGLPRTAAAFAIVSGDDLALVESGPAACAPTLQRSLAADPRTAGRRVRRVFVTHIHLDHAGAAGHFATGADRSDVFVHPFGAKHLVDPTKLIASSRRVHGDAFDRFYGEPIACPAERVHSIPDGGTVEVAPGVSLEAIETPGHARHHHAWVLRADDRRRAFAGDVAAMIVPDTRFISVPTPPPEFDLRAWRTSLDCLRDARLDELFLTHFGRVADDAAAVRAHLDAARRRLDDEAALAESIASDWIAGRVSEDEAIARYGAWLRGAAAEAAVPTWAAATFLGPAFCRMNLHGVRRWIETRPP